MDVDEQGNKNASLSAFEDFVAPVGEGLGDMPRYPDSTTRTCIAGLVLRKLELCRIHVDGHIFVETLRGQRDDGPAMCYLELEQFAGLDMRNIIYRVRCLLNIRETSRSDRETRHEVQGMN